jgi:hypothetical protein
MTNRSLLDFEAQTKNRHSDFETQITKPYMSVLRPKPENPPPPWFWGSTKKPTVSFEVKLRETVATSFEAKLEKTVATGFEAEPKKTVAAGFDAKPPETVTVGFEAKLPETVTAGFEAKPVKTVTVVSKPNHWQIVTIGFEAQTDEKPSPLVLRLNQETCAHRLHMHGADRT